MSVLPSARPSPRIVNGVLKWYQGDTFQLDIELQLEDQDGEIVNIASSDTVTVVFYDRRVRVVKEFVSTNIEGNTASLLFDEQTTALFPAGEYTYNVYLDGEKRTTLAKDNNVVVE